MPGFADILVILIVALFIFGTSKLPRIATVIGQAIVRARSAKNQTQDDSTPHDTAEQPPEIK